MKDDTVQYATGAKRSNDALPLSLIPIEGLASIAERFRFGASKYERDNWQKGIPYRDMIDHALTHLNKLNREMVWDENGRVDVASLSDDHIGAIGWFACTMAFFMLYHNPAEMKDAK